MKWKKLFYQYTDIVLAQAIGIIAIILSLTSNFMYLRWIFGFLYAFLLSGWSISHFLPKNSNLLERIITSSAISLLLTYPAAILTVVLEGQSPEAIFGHHLTTSLSSLFFISFIISLWVVKRRLVKPNIEKFPKLIIFPLLIYTLFTFINLNRADVFGDEYDLGYQAYNLVDGIKAGRKAYLLSMSGHPPLGTTIKHFSLNILNPSGLDNLYDWQFRVSEGLVGMMVIIVVYSLTKELFSGKAAIIASLLASVNNYLIWMGRIYHREMYLTFFLTITVFFFLKYIKSKKEIYSLLNSISLGSSLLVKETALILVISLILFAFIFSEYRKKILKIVILALIIFSPVVIYNLTAYFVTGYADVFFSNILGFQRPGATSRETNPIINLFSEISYIWDILSPLICSVLTVFLVKSLFRKKTKAEIFLLLWILISFVFFMLSSVRAYYFIVYIPPLIILAAKEIDKLHVGKMLTIVALILIYSSFYAFQTNIQRDYTRAEDIGGIDGSIVLKHPLNLHYSIAARSWVEEVGYKKLQTELDEIFTENDCLIVSSTFNSLASRRYLGLKDEIKINYLGVNYPSRYVKCPILGENIQGNIYYISNQNENIGTLLRTITDHLGNEKFYLYTLEKGKYT